MAVGIGIKVVDSNELRRKIRGPTLTHQNLSNSTISLDSAVVDVSVGPPPHIPPMNFDSESNHSSELSFIPQASEHSKSLQPHLISSDMQALNQTVSGDLKLESTVQSTVPSTSTAEFGEISPNSAKKLSPSRKLQQVFEQALIREVEGRATHLQINASPFKSHQEQVRVFSPNPKILYNARGNPYVEGDPNMGYTVEDSRPRIGNRVTGSLHPVSDFTPSSSTNNLTANIPHSQIQDNSLPNQNHQTSIRNQVHPTRNQVHHPSAGQAKPKLKPKNWATLLQSQSPALDMKLEYFHDL